MTMRLGLGLGIDRTAAASPAPLTSIAADGWQATYDGTPPQDPVLSTFTVSRSGYVGTSLSTISDVMTITKRVREAYPSHEDLTADTVALSDYIYSTDVVAGVTNNSTQASPKPIANWATLDREVIGDTLTAEVVAFHRDARNKEQVAAVRFYATDGTTTAEETVTASVLSGRTGDQNGVTVYKCNIDVSGLDDDAAITLNAEVYPHIGDASSVLDSADQSERREFSPRTYLRKTDGLVPLAYVDSAGGDDGTGVISTSAATAAASPFATISGAIGTTGGLRGHGTADGAEIRLTAGTHAMDAAFGVDLQVTGSGLKIVPEPGEDSTTVTVQFGATTFRPRFDAGGGWVSVEGCTLERVGTGQVRGESDSELEFRIVDSPFDGGGQSSSILAANSHALCVGSDFTNLGASTFAAGTQSSRMFRGCTGTPAGAIEGWLILGCEFTGWTTGGLTSGSGRVNGSIRAFSSHLDNGVRLDEFGDSTTAVSQIAVCQNIVETTTATSTAAMWMSADGPDGEADMTHVVIHHNTWVGFDIYGRGNLFYDDGTTASATNLTSVKGNIHCQINTKSDVFKEDGTRTGNWGYENGVGCQGEYSLYRDANGGGIGGSFAQDYAGLDANIGESNTTMNGGPAANIFTDYQATTSGPTAGAGGGDYSLVGGAGPKSMATAVIRFDASGAERSTTTSAGAYE